LRTQKYGSDTLNAIVAVQKAVLSGADELLWVDADRVWMMWHSMGGGVTMYALVTHPELIDAAVLYAPVHSNEFYNFNRWLKQRLDTSWYTQLQDRLWDLTDIQTFASFSPETYFNRVSAPVQIYFWTADESCPVERWRAIRDALVQHDKQVELIEYVWEKHEFTTERQSFMAWVVVFFTEQLKK
jgi:dipeptidyl aminopeptidase/acylaminoacyl peptidase